MTKKLSQNNIKKQIKKIFILALLFLLPRVSWAQSIITPSENGPYADGSYDLNDFISLLIGASQIILGLVGSLALLFFIYGGVLFLISGGSSDRITKGKTIIQNAVIGLLIVFLSYAIIQFVMTTFDFNGVSSWSTIGWSPTNPKQ